MLHAVVREPRRGTAAPLHSVRPPLHDVCTASDARRRRSKATRVLIFNCTNGRSAHALLGTAVAKITAQLELHGHAKDAGAFFDHVVFCTNVTYADGGFKGGASPSLTIPHRPTQCESH